MKCIKAYAQELINQDMFPLPSLPAARAVASGNGDGSTHASANKGAGRLFTRGSLACAPLFVYEIDCTPLMSAYCSIYSLWEYSLYNNGHHCISESSIFLSVSASFT